MRSAVIKLPQPMDFVRPAIACRIFALLQINDGLGLQLARVYKCEGGHVQANAWICGDPNRWLGASRLRFRRSFAGRRRTFSLWFRPAATPGSKALGSIRARHPDLATPSRTSECPAVRSRQGRVHEGSQQHSWRGLSRSKVLSRFHKLHAF